jgi:hypothetical protein
MKNEEHKTYYLNKSIELAKESRRQITINTSIIYDFPNDNELGKELRRLVTNKVDECDKHIKHITDILLERTKIN